MKEKLVKKFIKEDPGKTAVGMRIASALSSFDIPDYSAHMPDKVVYYGIHRIGREEIRGHTPHLGHQEPSYSYYYDKADPDDPRRRIGVISEPIGVSFYTLVREEGNEHFSYTYVPSPQEAKEFMKDMPPVNFKLQSKPEQDLQ